MRLLGRGATQRRGLAIAIVLVFAWVPAAAQADLTWSPAATLSPTGTDANDVQVATDGSGDAIAVWSQVDASGTAVIEASKRPAGGNFGAYAPISDPAAGDATEPSVSINASGKAVIVWQQKDVASGYQVMHYVTGSATGSLGAPQAADGAAGTEDLHPQVGLDAAGDAIAVFVQASDPTHGGVSAALMPAGGSFEANNDPVSEGVNNMSVWAARPALRLAVAPSGAAVATWNELPDITNSSSTVVEAGFRPAGGAPNPCGCGQPWPGFYYDEPQQIHDPSTDLTYDGSPAIDSSGNVLVAYTSDHDNLDGTGVVIKEAERPASAGETGPFGTPQTLSDTAKDSQSASAAFDSAGDALVAYQEYATVGGNLQIEAAFRPAGGSFGAEVPVSSADDNAPAGPVVGLDGQGRQTVVWVGGQTGYDVEAAWRASPSAAFSSPTSLGTAQPARGPVLSVGASSGQAVALWPHETPPDANNLSYEVAQAALGTPPGAKPPPPPPPPPPPIPNPIQLAAPIRPGGPIVLIAKVDSDVTRLDWHVDQEETHAIGERIDGVLQDGVRFHWFQREFTMHLTVDGPGGQHRYSRTFHLPEVPRDGVKQTVLSSLEGTAPVFAVGTAPVLLGTGGAAMDHPHGAGDPGCGKVTVFSAAQRLTGCMRPASLLSSIPDRERGVLDAVATNLNLDPSNLPVMQDAVNMMDGYISEGRTMIDDTWPVVPQGPADVMAFPQAQALTSSSASLEVAGQQFGLDRNGFSMNLDPRKADIPLGELPRPPKFPSIGGFEVVGDWNVDLKKREATIKASLKLPSWITTAGINVQNSVTFKATPTDLILEDVKVGPMSVDIGGTLGVQDFALNYDRAQDEWTGQGKACFIPDACLDLVPPNGEIKIKNGQLEFAGASVDFPPPGIPLFPLVHLERLGFGIGLDPTRITGNGRVSVADIVKLDGRMVMGFPSERTPFFLRADEVGGGFPSRLYGIPFTRYTLGATAAVIVDIPDVVTLELGHGYFLYQYPSYVAIGGGIDQTLFDFLRFYGNIGGEANFSDRTINLHGDIHGCIEVAGEICGGIVANASHGPGNIGGIGGCINIDDVNIGGGIQWNRADDPFIWPFDGCKWSRFAVTVNTAADAAAGRVRVVVKPGQPSPAVKIYGSGAAPLVRVTGPGGQRLSSTARGLDVSRNRKIRIVRSRKAKVSFTVVGIENDTPGVYTISALPGSVPFTRIEHASDLPDARVSVRLRGSGVHRLLRYDIRRRPAQVVRFFDVAEGGSARGIGTVRGGGRGVLRFSTAPGLRIHTVVAQFSLAGLPAERIVVAHFRPPSPVLPAPRGLRVVRQRRGLLVSWRAVLDATSYQVAITSPLGYQRVLTIHRPRVFVRLPTWIGGTVSVRALDPTRRGTVIRVRFRARGAAPRRIRPLGHCKIVRHKIRCTR